VAGEKATKDIFEGVDFTLNRTPGNGEIQKLVSEINAEYDVADPSKSVVKLLKLKQLVKGKPFKQDLLDDLILACAGIWFESAAVNSSYALNEPVNVRIQAIARTKQGFPLKISIEEINSKASFDLLLNQFVSQEKVISTSGFGITQPYWLEKKHPLGSYVVDSLSKIGLAENPIGLNGHFRIKIGDDVIEKKRAVVYKYTDQVRGEIYQPLVIAPPVTASMGEKAFIFNNNEPKKILIQLKSFKDNAVGVLKPELPDGWKASPERLNFSLSKKGEEQSVGFTITPFGNISSGNLSLNVIVDGETYHQGLHVIDYEHIPTQTLFPFAEAKVDKVDLKLAGRRIGYIAGAGDLVPESLKQIGYDVVNLTAGQVINGDLSGFDAIIAGVRLYNVSEQIKSMQPKLMKYVSDGGIYLVQYNVNGPLKLDNLGPYPFGVSRDRVTEEDAKVSILNPTDPVLNYPNKITDKDFDGWVQERGLYFVTDADQKYRTLLSMHDNGENDKTGSLIIANYGKGRFVYTGLSFFRQLPAGVPGAYRLFVNLISVKK
jgi:hypothetical protein